MAKDSSKKTKTGSAKTVSPKTVASKSSSPRLTKMEQLAEIAGVSVSTVSRALAGNPLINQKTRGRIVELAAKHNYQINEKARNFRLQKTNVIAVVLMLDVKSEQHISDMFFLEMLGAIADALSAQNYDLLLAHSPVGNVMDVYNSRTFGQSDGIIFIGQGNQHKQLNEFAALNKPMVVWGSNLPNRDYCIVGADNVVGGYLATKHLLNLGRKEIVFMGDINMPEPKQRFEGYLKALKEKGVKFNKQLQVDVPFEMSHASEAINDLLQQKIHFDGAVCCSDLIALSAIAALTESGLRVPEDVAVVGYDDIALASYSSPSLTTVRQNIVQGGRILVQKLMAQINGDTVADSVLKTELIVRRSSGAW